jgi:ABC-2 type transport system permease protein
VTTATVALPQAAPSSAARNLLSQLRSEARKLSSTWLWLWLLLGALGFAALVTIVTIASDGGQGNPNPPLSTPAGLRNLFSGVGAGSIFAIVLGVIGMTLEYRHQTATPTFLARPHRGQVVIAKLAVYAVAGLGYGLACLVLVLAVALPWLSAKGVDVPFSADGLWSVLAAGVAIPAIYALLGVGVGALIRNQIAAVVGTLVYLFVLEALIANIPGVRDYYKWFPGGAAAALGQQANTRASLLEPWQGGLLLVAYSLAFALAGTYLAVRRDVS